MHSQHDSRSTDFLPFLNVREINSRPTFLVTIDEVPTLRYVKIQFCRILSVPGLLLKKGFRYQGQCIIVPVRQVYSITALQSVPLFFRSIYFNSTCHVVLHKSHDLFTRHKESMHTILTSLREERNEQVKFGQVIIL